MTTHSRYLTALVAQFPITLDIQANCAAITALLDHAQPHDLVVLPEGALSGYDENPAFLTQIDHAQLSDSLAYLRAEVDARRIHLFFGSCLPEANQWFNAGLYYGPGGAEFVYHKVNLATAERGHFTAGATLPVFDVTLPERTVCVGMQLCREIRYPEQWRVLAQQGAEVLVYLTNAVGNADDAPIWRSHLISRAAENQRFVLAANNAGPAQKCPSMAITPQGRVLWEVLDAGVQWARVTLDLAQTSTWYLDQARTGIVQVVLRS